VSLCPSRPSGTGWRRREKKAEPRVEAADPDWALADFAGYLAADERSDGPFCVLSAVDAHRQRRLHYEVLDHDPTRVDLLGFLARRHDQIRARGRVVRGITTDGSPLYPEPIALVLPGVPHQVCAFHIRKELTKAVLRVLAQLRKHSAERKPKLPRGRPRNTATDRTLHRQTRAIGQRVAALFEHRHRFVRHQRNAAERKLLPWLVHSDRQLRAARHHGRGRSVVRPAMPDRHGPGPVDPVASAGAALPELGESLDQLHSPNREKALTFLDDKELPATSNAVERGNRRHRKMQKTVYRVRKPETLQGRLALDRQREQQASGRQETLDALHQERS
jgi:hypothetical protein